MIKSENLPIVKSDVLTINYLVLDFFCFVQLGQQSNRSAEIAVVRNGSLGLRLSDITSTTASGRKAVGSLPFALCVCLEALQLR